MPHILSVKHNHTYRKVRWAVGLRGSNNPPWITFRPCLPLLPLSTQPYSLTAYGTSLPRLPFFPPLKNHSKRILVAEWSLAATHSSAQPHVLAALAQAVLECHKSKSSSNIRTVLGPKRITDLALAAGWKLENETRVQPKEELQDGQWEVAACLSPSFEKELKDQVDDEREREVVLALRDACEASLQSIPEGRKGVHSMDVWIASFVRT